jgi:hypothetical protein
MDMPSSPRTSAKGELIFRPIRLRKLSQTMRESAHAFFKMLRQTQGLTAETRLGEPE